MALQALATVLENPSDETAENNSTADEVNLSSAAYLLSTIGNVLGNDTVDPAISEVSLVLIYKPCTCSNMYPCFC